MATTLAIDPRLLERAVEVSGERTKTAAVTRAAADLRTTCRRHCVQVGTVDALPARLCLRYDLVMLTAGRDFEQMARFVPLRLRAAS